MTQELYKEIEKLKVDEIELLLTELNIDIYGDRADMIRTLVSINDDIINEALTSI